MMSDTKKQMPSGGLGGTGLGVGFSLARGDSWLSLVLQAGWAGLPGALSLAWVLQGIKDRPLTVAPPNLLPGLGRS
jgi:hypothetical protein